MPTALFGCNENDCHKNIVTGHLPALHSSGTGHDAGGDESFAPPTWTKPDTGHGSKSHGMNSFTVHCVSVAGDEGSFVSGKH